MLDKELLPILIVGTLVITAFAIIIVVFLVIQKQRQIKGKLERQRLEHHYSQSLLNTKIEVQEQALKMVSQEIHDNVGQVLSSSSMQLTALRSYVSDGEGKDLLEDTLGLVRKSVKDLRLLSHSLNNGLIEHRELGEAIQGELDRIQAFSGIKCTLDTHDSHELNPEQRLLVFRIIQEALQNTLKHAGASEIDVNVTSNDHKVLILLQDNGKGFNSDAVVNGTSLGMTNMNARAKLLNADLKVTSQIGQGTKLSLEVPFN